MTPADYKQRAIEQWTADPCGPPADGAAELLDKRREYAPWMAAALDYAGAEGIAVLDVGCGQGIDLCEYALVGAHVTGVDLTPRHVELARAHLAELGFNGSVAVGDAEALPFADDSFDRVSSNGVLHHTPDMLAALREILRVLRSGGRATIIVYNRGSAHYWMEQVLRRGLLGLGVLREGSMAGVLSSGVERSSIGARPLVRVYSKPQLRSLMHAAGFEGVAVRASPLQARETSVTRLLSWAPPLPIGWYLIADAVKP
jgi:ubiquinone/menaquinone biosynthesis C-methylase UbiE